MSVYTVFHNVVAAYHALKNVENGYGLTKAKGRSKATRFALDARKAFLQMTKTQREYGSNSDTLIKTLYHLGFVIEDLNRSSVSYVQVNIGRIKSLQGELKEALIESLLNGSLKHSKSFQVVVLRNGYGGLPEHYEMVGNLRPAGDVPSEVLKSQMEVTDVEEFLTDEDYDPATNLREVAVREIRFGRKRASASFQEVTTTQLVFDEE